MKGFLKLLSGTLIATLIIIELLFFGIVSFPKGVFHSSYQSLIQDKFRVLTTTNEPKIIIVAGSSAAFGIDEKLLEEGTGYKVANLGLHAGFGNLFYSELAKANINKGDIVLWAYEYGWQDDGWFDTLGTDLIMSGIDDDIQIYRYIPLRKWSGFLGYLFTYADKKNHYEPESGLYSRDSFDSKTGQMTVYRGDIFDSYVPDENQTIAIHEPIISDATKKYLCGFKKYIEKKGANVYFVASPWYKDAVQVRPEDFENLKKEEEKVIGVPYISDPVAYLFPKELLFNSVNHCNSVGAEVRTRMLIEDLKNAGVVK